MWRYDMNKATFINKNIIILIFSFIIVLSCFAQDNLIGKWQSECGYVFEFKENNAFIQTDIDYSYVKTGTYNVDYTTNPIRLELNFERSGGQSKTLIEFIGDNQLKMDYPTDEYPPNFTDSAIIFTLVSNDTPEQSGIFGTYFSMSNDIIEQIEIRNNTATFIYKNLLPRRSAAFPCEVRNNILYITDLLRGSVPFTVIDSNTLSCDYSLFQGTYIRY